MQGTQPSSNKSIGVLEDQGISPHLKKLPLMEIFGPTVQGEGAVIGQQTYFLRFGLCDYKCTMCDSMHAVDGKSVSDNAEWLDQTELYKKLDGFWQPHSAKWVTLSGGNPCIHDLTILTEQLRANQWKIAVETQGTFCPPWLWNCDVVTVSPKSPGMGERYDDDVFRRFIDQTLLHSGLNVKIVVFDEADLEFAAKVFQKVFKAGVPWDKMYLSQGNPYPPGIPRLWDSDQILWNRLRAQYLRLLPEITEDPILSRVKFLPQWHVWLWANKKGV